MLKILTFINFYDQSFWRDLSFCPQTSSCLPSLIIKNFDDFAPGDKYINPGLQNWILDTVTRRRQRVPEAISQF